jgi:hypothetical protein
MRIVQVASLNRDSPPYSDPMLLLCNANLLCMKGFVAEARTFLGWLNGISFLLSQKSSRNQADKA